MTLPESMRPAFTWAMTLLSVLVLSLPQVAPAQVPAPDPALTLDAAGGAGRLARQDDGKVIAAGQFTKANGNLRPNLARFNSDGSLDFAFAPVLDGQVYAVVVTGNAVYVAGTFAHAGGLARSGLAKLRIADGGVDATFDPAPDGPVDSIAADAQGNLYAAGSWTSIGGVSGRNLVKLDGTTGAAESGWNPGFPEPLTSIGTIAIDNGFLYVVGYFAGDVDGDIGRAHRISLATGTRDATWAPPHARVNNEGTGVTVAFDAGGNVFIGGPGGLTFDNYGNGTQRPVVALERFLAANGAADPAWVPPTDATRALAIDGGAVYAITPRRDFGGVTSSTIVKRSATSGAVIGDWAPPNMGAGSIAALVVAPEGLWIAGGFAHLNDQFASGVARLDLVTGARQQSFLARVTFPGYGMTVVALPDGKLLLGGVFDYVNGLQRSNLARLLEDGKLDPSWTTQTNDLVWRLAVHGSYVYVGGYFTRAGGAARNAVARFDVVTGALDPVWNPNPDGGIRRMAFDDSSVYLGGTFETVGGVPRTGLAKVSGTDGSLIADFAPPRGNCAVGGTLGVAYAAGFVYAGLPSGCHPATSLARFAASTGAFDASWNPAGGSLVREILIAGADMYVVGDFPTFGGAAKSRLAKLDIASAAVDATWGDAPAAEFVVFTAAIAGPYLYTGGFSTDPATSAALPVVDRHLLTNGLRDRSWSPALKPGPDAFGISGLAVSPTGDRVFIAGNFAAVSGLPREGFAALSNTGAISPAAKANHQGLWWNAPAGSESGWGMNFAHQGDTIFVTWFTYDADGKPVWFIALLTKVNATFYAGDVSTVAGPPFDSVPFDPSKVTETLVGAMTVTFLDTDSAYVAYTVNGISQDKHVTRQVFAAPVPTCVWGAQADLATATNFQDLWWNFPGGSESGWGINFTQQGNTIFATWFTYGADGKPTWFIILADKTAADTWAGPISTVTGPPFNAVPFDPAKVVETVVGNATIVFANGNRATFDYTVNGITQSKEITRQVFAPPGTVCF